MSLPARTALQDAFLLHRAPYRETNLLLDMLTREHGVVRLLGKGVLRGRGMRSGVLRPFAPLSVSWIGRSGLPVLTDVEARGAVCELTGKALFCGFYLNELLLRLLPREDAHPRIFALYETTLRGLSGNEGLEDRLRAFELSLLDELGYGPELLHEAESGAPVEPDGYYIYQAELGLRRVSSPGAGVSGRTLMALRGGELQDAGMRSEAKRLMRGLIQHHLGGRPLKSRELFKFHPSTSDSA